VLDAVNLEKLGLPAAVVGLDKLVDTTGRGMANALGYPGLRMATIPYSADEWGGSADAADHAHKADIAAPQVERILQTWE
jgi:hypothetical protein